MCYAPLPVELAAQHLGLSPALISLLSRLPTGLAVVSSDDTLCYLNEHLGRLLEVSPTSLVGKPLTSLLLPSVWGGTDPLQVEGESLELRARHASQEPFWVRVESQRIPAEFVSAAGLRLLSVTPVLAPATARRGDVIEQLVQDVFALSPIGMVLASPRGLFLQVNHSLASMIGYEPGELIGKSFQSITHPDDIAKDEALYHAVLRGERTGFALLKRYLHRLGHVVPVHLAVSTIKDHDQTLRYFVGIVDSVAERDARQSLRQREEARLYQTQRFESLGHFAGAVAHEFNNILSVIVANADLAQGDAKVESEQADAIEQIRLAAQQASELTGQMLAYAGSPTGAEARVDLVTVVREMSRLLRAVVPRNCELAFELDPGPVEVEVDPARLRQVVMNLVMNAKAALASMPGKIRVAVGRRAVDARYLEGCLMGERLRPGPFALLTVEDNGPGIAPAVAERMFEPYFSTQANSRGLGLPTVLGVARSHRGAIRWSSHVGEGARFGVLFPLNEAGREGEGVARDAPVVLVVDDEPGVLKVVSRLLERDGLTATAARNGREALGLLRDGLRPDAMICDIMMPELDGIEFVREARAQGLKVPVIFLSGFSSRPLDEALRQLEPCLFLPKPDGLRELTRRLRGLLDGAPSL